MPKLANRRVLKAISSSPDDTVPALRAITMRDLLTSRLGFGSVMAMPDTFSTSVDAENARISLAKTPGPPGWGC
jgi:hypothetical protein